MPTRVTADAVGAGPRVCPTRSASCLDAKTGETVWQERLGRPRREGVSASRVVVDDTLFVPNDDGQTFVLRTGPDFEVLHINDIGARTLASPALVDGTSYIRTSRELIAIGHEVSGYRLRATGFRC